MSVSMFYPLDTMTVNEWFSMLANEKVKGDSGEEQENSIQDADTCIYEVQASDDFDFLDGSTCPPGIYYIRANPKEIEKLGDYSVDVAIRKLSFSDLVYLSDLFSTVVSNLIPENDELERLVDAGEAARYFEKELNSVPTKGLEVMRERVWTKYFDQGIMGIVRRIFSALANFFRKCNNVSALDTGIYWPGNSCHYADQVVQQLNRIKSVFIYYAYEASKEIVSERLSVPLEELESLKVSDLKKYYTKQVLQFHPDKNPGDPTAADKFSKVNRAWGDFIELRKLKEQFQSEISLLEDELFDSDEDIDQMISSKKNLGNQPLTGHQFKPLLSLTAPIAVS